MNSTANETVKGPAALVTSLLETLEDERQSLVRLFTHFDQQIEALRGRNQDMIDEATHRTTEEVNVLARLKQNRDRQVRLLGRVLRIDGENTSLDDIAGALRRDPRTSSLALRIAETRTVVKQQAIRTQDRCRDLEFSLQFAAHLGREILQALQGFDAPAGGLTYNASGGTVESKGTRSFLNKVG